MDASFDHNSIKAISLEFNSGENGHCCSVNNNNQKHFFRHLNDNCIIPLLDTL